MNNVKEEAFKMEKIKFLLLTSLIVVLVLALGLPVYAAKPPYAGTTIKVVTVREFSDEIEFELLHKSDFERVTGIKVEEVLVDFEEMVQMEKMDFLAGTGTYDVVGIDQPALGEYVENGWVVPIDEYLKLKDPDLDDFLPPVLDFCKYKGKLYGLPSYTYGNLLGFRKDLFKKAGLVDFAGRAIPPVTWEEYVMYGEKLMTLNPGTFAACLQARKGGYLGYDVGTYLWEWGSGYINGCDVYYEDLPKMHVLWDTPEGIAALKFYNDEIYRKLAPPETINYDIAHFIEAVRSGKIAMAILIQEAVGAPLEDPRYSKVVGKFAYAPVVGKKMPDGSLKRVCHMGGNIHAINADSRNKEAAYLVIEYLASKEIAKEFSRRGGKPFRFSHIDEKAYAKWPELKAQVSNLLHGRCRPNIPEQPAVIEILTTAYHRVLSKEAPLVETLKKACSEANEVLKKAYPQYY